MKRIILHFFIFSFLLLILAVTYVDVSSAQQTASNGVYLPTDRNLPGSDIKSILSNIVNWLLGVIGMVGIIGFIISGLQYMLSAGDDGRMETAKKNLYYSIIGVVVALSGFVAVKAIDAMLRGGSNF